MIKLKTKCSCVSLKSETESDDGGDVQSDYANSEHNGRKGDAESSGEGTDTPVSGLMPNVGEQGNCLFFNSVIRRASNRTVRQVYLLEERRQEMEHEIDGGMIVSDSDSDCVEEWNRVRDPLDEAGLQFIKKKRAAICRKPTRELNKRVAEKRYFRRRRSKRVGKTIENYIQKCCVGADSWWRTGVLTFDGNKCVGKKVNNEILLKNLSSAMDVYIRCIDQSQELSYICGRTQTANSERSKSTPKKYSNYNQFYHCASSTFNPQQNYSSPLQRTRRCPRVGARNSTTT
ncbi:hypothetical protein ACROYT_G014325 [Oculina patagonica]